jgi:signal transduction histidine kinase
MSYDIVRQIHKGTLEVKSKDGEYTEFIITIPEKNLILLKNKKLI